MHEALTKAAHDFGFACDDLAEAFAGGLTDEKDAILDALTRANALRRDVEALRAKVEQGASCGR